MLLAVDLVALAILAIHVFKGFSRGFIISMLGILGLVCAYFGAYLFYQDVGSWLSEKYMISPSAGYAVGGITVFLGTYICFGILRRIIIWRRRVHARDTGAEEVAVWDRLLGAALGGGIGLALVILMMWVYNIAQFSPIGEGLPDASNSIAGAFTETIIEKGTYVAARSRTEDKKTAEAVAKAVSNPKAAMEDLHNIVHHPKIKALSDDPEFLGAVMNGEEEIIKNNPALQEILHDKELTAMAQKYGMLPQDFDPKEYSEEAAEKLARAGESFDRIRNDPEITGLLEDEELKKLMEEGDVAKLVRHKKFQKVISRALSIIGDEGDKGVSEAELEEKQN